MAEIKLQHIFPAYNQGNKAMIYVGRRQAQMAKEHTQIFNAIETRDPPPKGVCEIILPEFDRRSRLNPMVIDKMARITNLNTILIRSLSFLCGFCDKSN